jgi:hypothetical protein
MKVTESEEMAGIYRLGFGMTEYRTVIQLSRSFKVTHVLLHSKVRTIGPSPTAAMQETWRLPGKGP